MKKGMSTSSIGIIAVLGVAIVIGWMTYQNMAGTGAQERITGITSTEESRELLETVKRTLKTDLIYSAQKASLDVANAGGGENCGHTGTRHWVSSGVFTAPTEEEVLCSLSNATLANMNMFLKSEREQYSSKNVMITDYNCAGSYNPSEAVAYPYLERDIELADAFQNGLTGGTIEVKGKGDQKDRYEGNIISDEAPNQFWSIYYTLYYFIRDEFNVIVTSSVRTSCPQPRSTQSKIRDGVDEACDKFREKFCGTDRTQWDSCCVKLTCVTECPSSDDDTSTCFQSEPPQELTQELCFEPKHTDVGGISPETPTGELIAQRSTTGSYRVKIDAVDECHKIDAENYLDWKLYIVDSIATNCEVVD